MIQIALQVVVALALLLAAIRLQVSLARDRSRDWETILKGFRPDHDRQMGLIEVAPPGGRHEHARCRFWSGVGGTTQLARIYRNLEVLLDAMSFITRQEDNWSGASAEVETIGAAIRRVQRLVFRAALMDLVNPGTKPNQAIVSVALNRYYSLIVSVGQFLVKHYPYLFRSYRYFVSWQEFEIDSNSISHGEHA